MCLPEKKSLQPSKIMAACSPSSIGCKPMVRQVVSLSCHISDALVMGATLTPEEIPDGDHCDRLGDLVDKGGVATIFLDVDGI